MNCSVYRSSCRECTYLYLAEGRTPDAVPDELMAVFGEPEFIIELELSAERQLANEDVGRVMANLAARGYHLQLPPGEHTGETR